MPYLSYKSKLFQSSPSMQRETVAGCCKLAMPSISILSLYAEGDNINWDKVKTVSISILSLYAEGDFPAVHFRLPVPISILSLYAEGDRACMGILGVFSHFNPLPLCRGRRQQHSDCVDLSLFQSSPSMQRETESFYQHHHMPEYFNPLPLCRGRPPRRKPVQRSNSFQSSPSMQRETFIVILMVLLVLDFNPLPLCRGRHILDKLSS